MKKFFLLSFFSFLFLSSCSFFGSDNFSDRIVPEKKIQTPNEVKEFIGKIEALDNVNIASRATHVLVSDEKEIEVSSLDLSLDSFLGKEVKATGTMEIFPNDVQVLAVKNIVLLHPEEEKTVTSWKLYNDKDSGLSFKYPENWQVFWTQKITLIKEGDEMLIKIVKFDNSQNIKLSDFVKENYQEVTVNQQLALKVQRVDGFDVYFSALDKVFKIALYNATNNSSREDSFLSFLTSLSFPEKKQESIQCGGVENTLCPEGYRCEINRGNFGLCVQLSSSSSISSFSPNIQTSIPEEALVPTEDALSKLYENTAMSYQLKFPQGWWWKSFGSTEGTLWHTEFSEKEIENIKDGSIIVDVKSGARGRLEEAEDNVFRIIIPRDENSHFELSGNIQYKTQLQSIAHSLISTY